MIHIIGIDPGLEGGIVVMDGDSRIARAMRPDVIGLCLDHSARKLMQEALLMRVAREGNPEISGCVQDFGSFRR